MHVVALECGIDGVAAAAEVDEVEELEMLFQLFLRNVEPLDDLARRDHSVVRLPARCEEVREERLQDRKALRDDRAGGTFARGFHV